MKKKYIIGSILILLTISVLFIVSYSWFEGEFTNRSVSSNEIKITTSKDLILSYKNSIYTTLNISDIIDEDFEFAQVTTTGLNDSDMYKIDYVKELDGDPAEYTLATANVDYLEFTVKLTSQQNKKRVYIDSSNSGFTNANADSYFEDGNYDNVKPADCMRCSISYQDSKTSSNRTIVFGNNNLGENQNKDSNGNPIENDANPKIVSYLYAHSLDTKDLYSYVLNQNKNNVSDYSYLYYQGKKQTNPKIIGDTDTDTDYCHLTGNQVVTKFTEYDFAATNDDNIAYENGILFDLEPYQEKNITIRIWLEGSAIPAIDEANDYIAGQGIIFSLRFSSSENFDVVCNTKYINQNEYLSFNVSQSVNTYLAMGTSLTNASFDKNNENYMLSTVSKTETSESITVNEHVYNRTELNGYYYYKCSELSNGEEVDPLWYDVSEQVARIQYNSLKWKLVNNVKNRRYFGDTSDNYVTIANLDSDRNVVVNSSAFYGESFSLIGYVDFQTGEDMTVVNEKYIVSELYESEEGEHVLDVAGSNSSYVHEMTNNSAKHCYIKPIKKIIEEVFEIDDLTYDIDISFTYNIKGSTSQGKYKYSELTWTIENNTNSYDITVGEYDSEKSLIINNWEDITNSTYFLNKINETSVCDYVFTLVGSITIEPTTLNYLDATCTFDVVKIVIVVNNGYAYLSS